MRPKASRCPPLSTMEMHCGTPISLALANAACSSFIAPSDVSFSEGTVSCMDSPLSHLLNMVAGDLLIALEDRPQLVLADDVLELVEALAAGALLDCIDDDVGRRGAVLQHDAAGRGQPRGFVGLERRDRVALAGKQARERCGIDDR